MTDRNVACSSCIMSLARKFVTRINIRKINTEELLKRFENEGLSDKTKFNQEPLIADQNNISVLKKPIFKK